MQLGDPCVISCVCPYQAAAGGMPSSHSLDFYLFSLQIKVHIGLITILEQGVLTFSLSMDPKKILHVEERGKTPLISPEPSQSRLEEPATVPACSASPWLASQGQRWSSLCGTFKQGCVPLVLDSHQTLGIRRRKEKVTINQEQTCCYMGNGEAWSL